MKVEDFKSFLDAQIRSTQKFDLQTDEDKSKLELNNQKEVDSIFESISISDDFIKLGLQEQVYSKLASQIENGTINFADLINNKSKINTYVDSCEKAIQKTPEYTKALEQYNEMEGIDNNATNSNVITDTSKVLLSTAAIDKMIENYAELSSEEVESLYSNYANMTQEQKDEVDKKEQATVDKTATMLEKKGQTEEAKSLRDNEDLKTMLKQAIRTGDFNTIEKNRDSIIEQFGPDYWKRLENSHNNGNREDAERVIGEIGSKINSRARELQASFLKGNSSSDLNSLKLDAAFIKKLTKFKKDNPDMPVPESLFEMGRELGYQDDFIETYELPLTIEGDQSKTFQSEVRNVIHQKLLKEIELSRNNFSKNNYYKNKSISGTSYTLPDSTADSFYTKEESTPEKQPRIN